MPRPDGVKWLVEPDSVRRISASVDPTGLVRDRVPGSLMQQAVQLDDPVTADENYENLKPLRGIMLRHVPVSIDRLLGLLSQTMDNPDQAATHFEDALTFCRKAGYRPELAWTCCDYADTLLQRDNPGDGEHATSPLDESLAISTELGMRPLMERVLSRRDILKA